MKEFGGKKSNKGSIRFGNRVAREGGREHEGMTRTISSIFAWDGSLTDSSCKRPLRSSIAVSVRVRSRVFLRRSGEDATAATKTLHHQILGFDKITIGKHTDIPTRTIRLRSAMRRSCLSGANSNVLRLCSTSTSQGDPGGRERGMANKM